MFTLLASQIFLLENNFAGKQVDQKRSLKEQDRNNSEGFDRTQQQQQQVKKEKEEKKERENKKNRFILCVSLSHAFSKLENN